MTSRFEFVDPTVPQEFRERVLAAALDEVTRWGLERFDIGAMAARYTLDDQEIHRYWGSRQRLLLDLIFFRADEVIVTPNTGSLRGDLEAMALSVAGYLNTSVGRRLHRAMVMDDRMRHPDDTRMIFWRRRYETVRSILDQAAVRGELRNGVDPRVGVQVLLAPINIRGLYDDQPIEDEYCRSVADMAYRALVRR